MKAQVAIEFMIIFGVFLVAITVTVLAAWNSMANTNKSSIDFEANGILNTISNKINTAFLEGHGFSTNLTIPENIMNYNYTLTREGNMMWLNIENLVYSRRLLTNNITGNFDKGVRMLENVNGEIVIS